MRQYEEKSEEENRELKTGSNLNVNSELTIKESFHHGVAVPMSMDDYEKELAREKDLVNKAKKKISMESSTPKEGISTWILLSGSSDLKTSTTTNRPEVNSNKPAYRNDNTEKKNAVKNNISNNSTATTKKRIPVTQSPKTPKPTQKTNNKLVTRVKVSSSEEKITTEAESSTVAHTTKKAQLTTKAKKYTTTKPKTTVTTAAPTKKTTTTTTSTFPPKLIDDSMVIDDEKDEVEPIETSTYLIMEAKDDEFNLPNDRAPIKSSASKKTSSKNATNNKTKKKKIPTTQTALAEATNSTTTKIKKKSDKTKTGVSKITKKPEKPITTQIYNYLAREVMPTKII
ncbi:hypothetical protein PVAND_002320 [Polypedilum vanderplanki]|uniref:Uncharacterized protein n=1 Tax=Polypedilum vanderplanki TaxID=319348 RepID=A0A9J6BQM0_POLVA|nr:hypothetical protein PVAND_002320 [Polypedilum vanderplanki]